MILNAIVELLVFIAGLAVGYGLRGIDKQAKPKKPDPEASNEILVKRNRPSFRHPGRTNIQFYDSYKQSNGLYATVRQGKSNADEVVKK